MCLKTYGQPSYESDIYEELATNCVGPVGMPVAH